MASDIGSNPNIPLSFFISIFHFLPFFIFISINFDLQTPNVKPNTKVITKSTDKVNTKPDAKYKIYFISTSAPRKCSNLKKNALRFGARLNNNDLFCCSKFFKSLLMGFKIIFYMDSSLNTMEFLLKIIQPYCDLVENFDILSIPF